MLMLYSHNVGRKNLNQKHIWRTWCMLIELKNEKNYAQDKIEHTLIPLLEWVK